MSDLPEDHQEDRVPREENDPSAPSVTASSDISLADGAHLGQLTGPLGVASGDAIVSDDKDVSSCPAVLPAAEALKLKWAVQGHHQRQPYQPVSSLPGTNEKQRQQQQHQQLDDSALVNASLENKNDSSQHLQQQHYLEGFIPWSTRNLSSPEPKTTGATLRIFSRDSNIVMSNNNDDNDCGGDVNTSAGSYVLTKLEPVVGVKTESGSCLKREDIGEAELGLGVEARLASGLPRSGPRSGSGSAVGESKVAQLRGLLLTGSGSPAEPTPFFCASAAQEQQISSVVDRGSGLTHNPPCTAVAASAGSGTPWIDRKSTGRASVGAGTGAAEGGMRTGSDGARKVRRKRRLNGQRVCLVCGDRALAHNFDVITCESCKAFFRRNAFKTQTAHGCIFQNHCVISKHTRRFCPACRLKKCFAVGMKPELILDDDERRQRLQKKTQRLQRQMDFTTTTTTAATTTSTGLLAENQEDGCSSTFKPGAMELGAAGGNTLDTTATVSGRDNSSHNHHHHHHHHPYEHRGVQEDFNPWSTHEFSSDAKDSDIVLELLGKDVNTNNADSSRGITDISNAASSINTNDTTTTNNDDSCVGLLVDSPSLGSLPSSSTLFPPPFPPSLPDIFNVAPVPQMMTPATSESSSCLPHAGVVVAAAADGRGGGCGVDNGGCAKVVVGVVNGDDDVCGGGDVAPVTPPPLLSLENRPLDQIATGFSGGGASLKSSSTPSLLSLLSPCGTNPPQPPPLSPSSLSSSNSVPPSSLLGLRWPSSPTTINTTSLSSVHQTRSASLPLPTPPTLELSHSQSSAASESGEQLETHRRRYRGDQHQHRQQNQPGLSASTLCYPRDGVAASPRVSDHRVSSSSETSSSVQREVPQQFCPPQLQLMPGGGDRDVQERSCGCGHRQLLPPRHQFQEPRQQPQRHRLERQVLYHHQQQSVPPQQHRQCDHHHHDDQEKKNHEQREEHQHQNQHYHQQQQQQQEQSGCSSSPSPYSASTSAKDTSLILPGPAARVFNHVSRDVLPSDPFMYWIVPGEERFMLASLSHAYQDVLLSLPERGLCRQVTISDNYVMSDFLTEIDDTMYKIVQFSKQVPDFRAVRREDQISLLKASAMQTLGIACCAAYVAERDCWLSMQGDLPLSHLRKLTNDDPYIQVGVEYCRSVKSLVKNDFTIYALIHCMLLFDPRDATIVDRQLINSTRDRFVIMLKHYLESQLSYLHADEYFVAIQERLREMSHLAQSGNALFKRYSSVFQPLIIEMLSSS